jgi:hypothetical protein
MERYPFEEFTKAIWVPGWDGIENMSAPTDVELNDAGNVDLTCFLTRDGLQIGFTTAKVGDGSLCTRNNTETVGSVSSSPNLKMFRDKEAGGDDAWNLAVWNAKGFLVVRRGPLWSVAFAENQAVEVFKSSLGEPSMASSAQDTNQTFDLPVAFAGWDQKAVVVEAAA